MVFQTEKGEVIEDVVCRVAVEVRDLPTLRREVAIKAEADATPTARHDQDLFSARSLGYSTFALACTADICAFPCIRLPPLGRIALLFARADLLFP